MTDSTTDIKDIRVVKQCNFCGKSKEQVYKVIVADNVGICDECIELCNKVLTDEKAKAGVQNLKPKSAKEIVAYLNETMVGQHKAKRHMAVGVVNHYKRLMFDVKGDIEKNNQLIIGPTGSGKTFMAKQIAKFLDVPIVIADATSLTESGYVGDDVESIISSLLMKVDYNVARAEQGIIFLDEIDKIGRKSENVSITRDVSGEGVQQALLKLVEGTKVRVAPQGGRKHPQQEMIEVDTSKILFIGSGAFVGLETNEKSLIGFNSNSDQNKKLITTELINFGMIPEFVGRFPVVVQTKELTKDELKQILADVDNNLIDQTRFYFDLDNVSLIFSEKALDKMVDIALQYKVGARALKGILETTLLEYYYELDELKGKEVIINDTDVQEA
jgi:ATP-dependent Clp protease ATP-binding subunit ClpX